MRSGSFLAPRVPWRALPEDIARYRDKYLAGWDEMRAARYAKQQQLKLLTTPLSKLERDVGPPYAFPEAIAKLVAERDAALAAVREGLSEEAKRQRMERSQPLTPAKIPAFFGIA